MDTIHVAELDLNVDTNDPGEAVMQISRKLGKACVELTVWGVKTGLPAINDVRAAACLDVVLYQTSLLGISAQQLSDSKMEAPSDEEKTRWILIGLLMVMYRVQQANTGKATSIADATTWAKETYSRLFRPN